MAEGDDEQTKAATPTDDTNSPSPSESKVQPNQPVSRRQRLKAWTTASLGRQITVTLGVALLAGAGFIGLFSLVLLGDARPWLPVEAANADRDAASVEAEEAAGTPRADTALAAYDVAESRAAATSAQAREAVRTGLLVVAGFGGVWGLVVAYRRQQHLEQHERPQAVARSARESTQLMTERFRVAAEMLGSSAVATRLAGVYAMAALADEWERQQQQCIDVLCAYLRTPWYPEGTPAGGRGEEQVRLTIIAVMRNHLLPDAQQHWRTRNFDLRAAVLPDFDWRGIHLEGSATFAKTTFGGSAWFGEAMFGGTALFLEAKFGGHVEFSDAKFEGSAWFGEAMFGGTARFDEARFGGDAGFSEATFFGDAWFRGARFHGPALFRHGATFKGDACFHRARFRGTALFSRATFDGDAQFVNARFGGIAAFGEAMFGGSARFEDARFGGIAAFGEAMFGGDAQFGDARFNGNAEFSRASFGGHRVNFSAANKGRARIDLTHAHLGENTTLILPDGSPVTEPCVVSTGVEDEDSTDG